MMLRGLLCLDIVEMCTTAFLAQSGLYFLCIYSSFIFFHFFILPLGNINIRSYSLKKKILVTNFSPRTSFCPYFKSILILSLVHVWLLLFLFLINLFYYLIYCVLYLWGHHSRNEMNAWLQNLFSSGLGFLLLNFILVKIA